MSKKMLALVARRDSQARLQLYSALDRAGVLVATCSDGVEALKYIALNRPEIVFCGTQLRDIGGLPLIRQIKSMAPEARVFLMSPEGDWALYRDVVAVGGEDLLIEPVDEERLLEVLGRKHESEPFPR